MTSEDHYKLLNCRVRRLEPFDLIDYDYMKCIYDSLKGLAELIRAISEGLIIIE